MAADWFILAIAPLALRRAYWDQKVVNQLIKTIFLAAFMGPGFAVAACPTSGHLELGEIAAQATSLHFASDNGGKTVTTFGTLKNASAVCVQEIFLEVKYLDSKGDQVDVVTQSLPITIAPGQETAFRVRDDADNLPEAYATSTVKVISAEPRYGRQATNDATDWLGLFISWLPTLVFIVVLALVMRRLTGKNSVQRQNLLLMERQQESLERIAAALEKRI